MVLSNAERQARYRKNLRKRAQDPGAVVRDAVDASLLAMWSYYVRTDRLEELSAQTFKHWCANMRRSKSFGDVARLFLEHRSEVLSLEERQALEVVRDAADALDLLSVRAAVAE